MVINIVCKLEKASYNIFFIRAVMVKSLYTLRLSSGYNDLLNSRAANEPRCMSRSWIVLESILSTRLLARYCFIAHVMKRLCKICCISAFPSHNIN